LTDSKSALLPIRGRGNEMVGDLGIEPSCLSATDLQSAAVANAAHHPKLVDPVGLEPTTSNNGDPGGARTHDLGFKRPVLYLLSYWIGYFFYNILYISFFVNHFLIVRPLNSNNFPSKFF